MSTAYIILAEGRTEGFGIYDVSEKYVFDVNAEWEAPEEAEIIVLTYAYLYRFNSKESAQEVIAAQAALGDYNSEFFADRAVIVEVEITTGQLDVFPYLGSGKIAAIIESQLGPRSREYPTGTLEDKTFNQVMDEIQRAGNPLMYNVYGVEDDKHSVLVASSDGNLSVSWMNSLPLGVIHSSDLDIEDLSLDARVYDLILEEDESEEDDSDEDEDEDEDEDDSDEDEDEDDSDEDEDDEEDEPDDLNADGSIKGCGHKGCGCSN
jgi:hypothetical protein